MSRAPRNVILSPLGQAFMHFGCALGHAWRGTCALFRSPAVQLVCIVAVVTCLLLFITGCASRPGRAIIGGAQSLFGGNTPETRVEQPRNAETPATVSQGEQKTDVIIQPGTRMELPVMVNGVETMAKVELPELRIAQQIRRSDAAVSAERAPDRTVEIRREDNRARMPLLYAAIGAAALAVVALFLKYPSGAALSALASAAFFAAWMASGLPAWFWMVGVAALAVGAGLYFGYEKRERESRTRPNKHSS